MQLGQDFAERPGLPFLGVRLAGCALRSNGAEINVEVGSLEEVVRDLACEIDQAIQLLVEVESSDRVAAIFCFFFERCEVIKVFIQDGFTFRIVWHSNHPFRVGKQAMLFEGASPPVRCPEAGKAQQTIGRSRPSRHDRFSCSGIGPYRLIAPASAWLSRPGVLPLYVVGWIWHIRRSHNAHATGRADDSSRRNEGLQRRTSLTVHDPH
jgi:hypothetical protein